MSTLLSKLFGSKSRKTSRSRPFRPRETHLQLESLESRLVPTISYHGGPILDQVVIHPIYFGTDWNSNLLMRRERQKMDAFLTDMVKSPLMTALSEYYMSDPYAGKLYVGKGACVASEVLDVGFRTDSTGARVIDNNDIQYILSQEIANGRLQAGGSALMMVFTPANVVTVSPGGNATNYLHELAHHTFYNDAWAGAVPYAIVPNPIGNPTANKYWSATTTDLQKLTGTASHEFEEAVTDPQLNAWYDASPPSTNITEIGDYTQYYEPDTTTFGQNQQFSLLNGYAVQNVWSVKANNTVALPQTPADLVGTTFTFHPNYNWRLVAGVLSIQSEDPSTGAFSGWYQSQFGRIPVGGQLSSTTTSGGTMTSNISFSGAGYNYPFFENVSYQGQVTGNGNAASYQVDSTTGTLVDYVYYVPNNYSLWYVYGASSNAYDA